VARYIALLRAINVGAKGSAGRIPMADMRARTEKLGYEVRSDSRFGENGEYRWLEVAPPGSAARLALNPPMGGQPGGGSIGVETPDARAEHARLTAIGGVDLDPEPADAPGAPLLFMLRDPDGNHIAVVEVPPTQ